MIFEEMEKRGHEELIFNYNEDVDLRMIVSLHDTTLGRTLGGVRMRDFDSDAEAVGESLKLSEIMTSQCATADIDSGGSNVILWGDPGRDKNEAYFRAVGRLIESLKGRLIVYPDLGTDSEDFKYIQRETGETIFQSSTIDNSRVSAEITALGVYWGIKACAKAVFGSPDLKGRSFAVQGLGKVGNSVVEYLYQEDVKVAVSDLVYDSIKEVEDRFPDVSIVRPEEIMFEETDFLVPCALGSIITPENIDRLRCRIIAGSAYNVFSEESLVQRIHKKGILYAPDFVMSAGELFLLDKDLKLGSPEKAKDAAKIIYPVLIDVLLRALEEKLPPVVIARKDALDRYRIIDRIKNILC